MRDFIADVLTALDFLHFVATTKREHTLFRLRSFATLTVAQRFAIALEVVRIQYELDDARYAVAHAVEIAHDAMRATNISLCELADAKLEQFDVHSFAVAAYAITSAVELN